MRILTRRPATALAALSVVGLVLAGCQDPIEKKAATDATATTSASTSASASESESSSAKASESESSSDKPSESESASASESESSSDKPSESDSASSSAAPAGDYKEQAVKPVTLEDKELGHKVEAEAIIVGFPIPQELPRYQREGTLVLVKVKATAGEVYRSSFYVNSATSVKQDNGEKAKNVRHDEMEAALKAAGLDPFPGEGRVQAGDTATGWLAYRFEQYDPAGGLNFDYQRLEAKVLGEDKVIPGSKSQVKLEPTS